MGQGSTARSSLVSFWNLEKTGARRCYPAQLCSEPRASMLRSPMSATLFRWEGWTDHAPMDQVQSQFIRWNVGLRSGLLLPLGEKVASQTCFTCRICTAPQLLRNVLLNDDVRRNSFRLD